MFDSNEVATGNTQLPKVNHQVDTKMSSKY